MGDDKEWSEVNNSYYPLLRWQGLRALKSAIEADFHATDVLSRAFDCREQCQSAEKFPGWILKISASQIANRFRRGKKTEPLGPGAANVAAADVPRSAIDIDHLLSILSARDQTIVELRLFDRVRWAAIAAIVNCPKSTCASGYVAALRKMRNALEKTRKEFER